MAVHDLIVKNLSNHDQRFQVHGWNNNQDIVVKPKSEVRIKAPDKTSGAIIAVHDGQIGEQAELTKCGYMDLDFFDLSNICGAGGNMIVMQVGEPGTAKGDPRFMQGLQDAWKKASQKTKDELKNCVTVKDGRPIRIAAPKDFPKLEAFVRTWANGKTYIGVGAWGGHAGNPEDNKQSSAAKTSRDCLILYSDDPITIPKAGARVMNTFAAIPSAEIGGVPIEDEAEGSGDQTENADTNETEEPKGEEPTIDEADAQVKSDEDVKAQAEALLAAAGGDPSAIPPEALLALAQASGDVQGGDASVVTETTFVTLAADQGPGIQLTNKSKKETDYYFYDNYWNGNGTAGANFDKPLKNIKLKPDASQFVSLPRSFKGRVQRGTQLPCTWVEFQLDASDDHKAHGDISLQQGCDGAATIASTDGTNVSNGFTHDVVTGAPAAAIRKKPNGERATDTTVGNWMGGPNKAAIDYLNKVVGQRRAYIVGGTGTPDVASKNNRLAVVMY